jgi:predicted enzyme related to lactoylglutathione lyase
MTPERAGTASYYWRDTTRDRFGSLMARLRPSLIEFPADDPERAQRFWSGVLDVGLEARGEREGEGWQTRGEAIEVGIHARGRGPGDSFSLPYFTVENMPLALERVTALGGAVVHSGERWAVCRDSEASPFGLALEISND